MESARLIGIDTPETGPDGRTPTECGSQEATAFLTGLLQSGEVVTVNTDAQRHDHYGRLLSYVYRAEDNLFVNLETAATSSAYELPIESNTRRTDEIAHAVQQAHSQKIGPWRLCPLRP